MMPEYTPFLKFKQNEISALAEFERYRNKSVVPFFDIPRPKDISESEILDRIRIGVRQIERHLPDANFYIDNFDLDDSINLNGKNQYTYILQAVSHLNAIPVVALNRDGSHNPAALTAVQKIGCDVAIRLTIEDIESYKLTKPDLVAIWPLLIDAKPREIHVIIDFRVIASDLDKLKDVAVNFVNSLCADFYVDRIVFTGSSIPPVITAILSTNSSTSIERQEWHLWKKIEASLSKSILSKSNFGDYGLVSPEYSDLDLEIWLVQGVAAPKVFYTYDTRYFVVRGGAFKTHPNGYGQYFDIADAIVAKPFYRKPAYSFGDKYIYDRSTLTTKRAKRGGSPSSWLKATLSSHITFIVDAV
ncbi:beta family protein [Burkholderia sp. MSMB1826]|uniref:beta family protein n=1 Tax=Burkholderia sp. MSMB1826 TaxID=1637875 RepID=UPI0009EC2D29|nr:beta family protein [Burkholderia sp. MSMB1826]